MNNEIITQKISSVIHSKDPTAEAFLYGSRARGDNKPDSDWDILILVDNNKVTNEIEDKFWHDIYAIEIESGEMISILIYPKEYWKTTLKYSPLYNNVKKEGIRL